MKTVFIGVFILVTALTALGTALDAYLSPQASYQFSEPQNASKLNPVATVKQEVAQKGTNSSS